MTDSDGQVVQIINDCDKDLHMLDVLNCCTEYLFMANTRTNTLNMYDISHLNAVLE